MADFTSESAADIMSERLADLLRNTQRHPPCAGEVLLPGV
jgi:hypothetical protein